MELFFYLFSFDATVDYHDASCGEKLHGVVLIYRLILGVYYFGNTHANFA